MDAGVVLESIFVEASALGRRDIEDLVDRAAATGAGVWELAPGALARLTDVVHPPGVAAIAASTSSGVDRATSTSSMLVLAGVSDPGNAGTLLRTADAAGFSSVVFCAGAVDPSNPKCVRASAGAIFRIAVVIRDDPAEVLDELGALGYRRIATQVDAARPYDEADLTGPVAIVLGSEAHGLPGGMASLVDEAVTIPMVGSSESLNVAMAGSIICFEALRQRRAV